MFSWRSALNPCCGPKIAPSVTPSAWATRSTTWTNAWSIDAGLATTPTRLPRRRPEARSRVEPSVVVPSIVVMTIGSFRKWPALGLDDPAQPDEAEEAGEADPEEHFHRRFQGGGPAARGHRADHERPDCRGDAADVVAEARSGAAQARREELGQVVGEAPEDAENGQPDREV